MRATPFVYSAPGVADENNNSPTDKRGDGVYFFMGLFLEIIIKKFPSCNI